MQVHVTPSVITPAQVHCRSPLITFNPYAGARHVTSHYLQAVAYADVARCHVDEHSRDEVGGDAAQLLQRKTKKKDDGDSPLGNEMT